MSSVWPVARGLWRKRGASALWLFALGFFSLARASDADELLPALQKARVWQARGQVQVTVLFPPRQGPTRLTGKLPVLPLRPRQVIKSFRVVKFGTDTLAGRTVTRYDLTPLNPDAARWRFWIDDEWNVPLSFDEHSADGHLSRRAAFRKVNAKLAKVEAPSLSVPDGLRAAVQQSLPGLRSPAGFIPVAVKRSGERWEITLSDGLNTLALVTAPRNVKAAPGVASRRVGGRFVWLVGNLSPAALEAALSGIKSIDESALGTFLSPSASNP